VSNPKNDSDDINLTTEAMFFGGGINAFGGPELSVEKSFTKLHWFIVRRRFAGPSK
jgi:hypothetical protein